MSEPRETKSFTRRNKVLTSLYYSRQIATAGHRFNYPK